MSSVNKFLDTCPMIEEVNKRIKSLRDDVRAPEQYRNARLLIISRLPPEILSIIFKYLALSRDTVSKRECGTRYPYRACLPASQVCRYWRNVALDSPRMWGCIYDNTSIQFTTLLLERAKSAPLYLLAYATPHNSNDATVKQLLHRSSQLREIELKCEIGYFQSIAGMKTSIFESLSLEIWSRWLCTARFDPAVEPGTVPPLRYLSLMNCTFDLDVSFFSHLRTLKLGSTYSTIANTGLFVNDILLALGNMQYLEVLELVKVIRGSDRISDNLKVYHPRLRRILVEAADKQALMLFDHLSCPNIQSAVAQTGDVVEPEALAPIAPAFYSMIPTSPKPWKVRAYMMPLHQSCAGEMHIWPDSALEDADPPFRISVIGPLTLKTNFALVSSLTTGTPHILDLAHGAGFDETNGDLQAFLQSLEGVREHHIHSIDDLLLVLADTPARINGTLFSFPSLKNIYIVLNQKIIYRQWKLKKLGEMLVSRNNMNAGIETLKIRCSVGVMSEKDAECLKPLVGTLDFASQDTW